MSSTAYAARRTARTGALVVVTDPATARALVGEFVDLIAPDGTTAHGRVAAVGRTWTAPDGAPCTYAYLDPQSVVTDAA